MNNDESKTEDAPKSPRYSADEGVLLLDDWIHVRAAGMCRSKPDLIDDLAQAMSLGVLRCRDAHTLGFFKRRAVLRGIDFLRREKRHRIKVERYGLLSHRISEDDDTALIEGLIDLENQLSSRPDRQHDAMQLYPHARASA